VFYQYTTYNWGTQYQPSRAPGPAYATTQLADVKEYDYGAVTSACQLPSSTPKKKTKTTYAAFANPSFWQAAPYMSDRPATIQIYDNGTLIAETDYHYDETGVASVSPAAYNHDETQFLCSGCEADA
jgi:hypothetical protein